MQSLTLAKRNGGRLDALLSELRARDAQSISRLRLGAPALTMRPSPLRALRNEKLLFLVDNPTESHWPGSLLCGLCPSETVIHDIPTSASPRWEFFRELATRLRAEPVMAIILVSVVAHRRPWHLGLLSSTPHWERELLPIRRSILRVNRIAESLRKTLLASELVTPLPVVECLYDSALWRTYWDVARGGE